MIKSIITFLCLLVSFSLYSQNIKTGVLVVGSTPAAMAAAIQSAKSGAKTVLIDAGKFDALSLSASNRSIKAGIYLDFKKLVDSLQKYPLQDNQALTPAFTAQVFKLWTDTLKNLTVLPNSTIKEIERWGKGWEVDLVGGREIKAEVMVDATQAFAIAKMVSPNFSPVSKPVTGKAYRTSVAIAESENTIRTVPLADLLVPQTENLVLASSAGHMSLLTGQAAGATAAYCVWFNTTTKNMKIRDIQTELLGYKSQIIKYNDIAYGDSSMIAFQHIGVTGILKGKEESGRLLFMPDAPVSTEELKQPLKEYYSRSHIWFLDNKQDSLTLDSALSLIRFLASRGNELVAEVQKGWKTSLKLKSEFDLKKVITRRELAVLLDTYLQPYTVPVDLEGNVKR